MTPDDKRKQHDGQRCRDVHPGEAHVRWLARNKPRSLAKLRQRTGEVRRRPDPPLMTQEQVAAIVECLNRHEVAHVFIGGMAGQLHGIPVPATRDADITPEASTENFDRLAAALSEMNAVVAYDGDPPPIEVPLTAELFSGMVNMQFITAHGPLDVNIRTDGTGGYSELAPRALVTDVLGVQVRLAAPEDILRSKQAAGRAKDLEAIPVYLRWLRDR